MWQEYTPLLFLQAELDALGDEIGFDEDTSYLDDAVAAPSVPTSEIGGDSMRVSCIFYLLLEPYSQLFLF